MKGDYMPIIRGILPAWVWRRVKEMMTNVNIQQIEQYVFYATKEFVAINTTYVNESRIGYWHTSSLCHSTPRVMVPKSRIFLATPLVFSSVHVISKS